MYRCFTVAVLAAVCATAAFSQVQRNFPQNALRGEIVVVEPPEILLNGRAARLAPGARIRGIDNMLAMSGALVGARLPVNYTVEINGLVKDVWVLRTDEAANKPWPATPQETQSWRFDPAAQSWSKP